MRTSANSEDLDEVPYNAAFHHGLHCLLSKMIFRERYKQLSFLAHRIRISDILSWDRKSYLTHVILPRLSREGCTLVVLELTRHMFTYLLY